MERHQKFAESLWRTRQSVKPCIFFISFYPLNMFFKLYICFVPACSCACRSLKQRAEEKVLGLILAIRLWGHASSCFCLCPTYCRPTEESDFQPTLLSLPLISPQECWDYRCVPSRLDVDVDPKNWTQVIRTALLVSLPTEPFPDPFSLKILFCVCCILVLEGY